MRVLLVHSHPQPESFIAAARDRARAGLAAAGHQVELVDLDAEAFEARLSADEWRAARGRGSPPPLAELPGDVRTQAERLRWAQALVLVYPTWWGAQPATLKGWLDRVWLEGVAYSRPAGTRLPRPLLRDIRHLVAVTTHGSSKWINAIEGEPGKRIVLRQMRACCHPLVRARWVALYRVDRSDVAERRAFLHKVERTMRQL